MKRKFFICSISLILLLILGAVACRYAFYQGYLRMNYPTTAEYPVQGIDISHHQGHIQWNLIDTSVVSFAFIKATEGAEHKDTLFVENWHEAQQRDILVGAYHYFSFCKSGEEQAANFIATVPKDSLDLSPIIDLEYGGNCKVGNRKADIIKEVTDYINRLESYYHKRVIIYSTNEFYKNNLISRFSDNPIWIRDILTTPQLPDGRAWTFWQFTNRGQLDGIDSKVDLNAFNGDRPSFEKLKSDTIPL